MNPLRARSLRHGLWLAVGLLLALLLARPATAGDARVGEFKKAWAEASVDPEPPADGGDKNGKRGGPRPDTPDQVLAKRGTAQLAALEKLKPLGTVDAAQALAAVLVDPRCHWKAHAAALEMLGKAPEKPIHDWVTKAVASDPDARLRCLLCGVVASWGEEDAVKGLVPLLRDKAPTVVAAAADVLSHVKKIDVVDALVAAIKDARDARAIDDLSTALRVLTGRAYQDPGEWTSWWSAEKEKFSFDAPASEPAKVETGGGLPKTTSDGSGLFDKVASEHVCFLIDNSGSMRIQGEVLEATAGGAGTKTKDDPNSPDAKKKLCTRLEYVQKELVSVIDNQLSKKASFNVMAFASDVVPWQKKLVPANDGNRTAAKSWVTALKPTSETNIYGALEAAFADKEVDTIYLLTDGFPDFGRFIATDSIVGEVKKWNATRKVRIHCICYLVGEGTKFKVIENKSMSKTFMKTLAEETGGTFKVFE